MQRQTPKQEKERKRERKPRKPLVILILPRKEMRKCSLCNQTEKESKLPLAGT